MQRITEAFASAKSEDRAAFVAYWTVGYPSPEESELAIERLIEKGADIIELGVPFSDPFADGGVIRKAAYEAIAQDTTIDTVLEVAARVRSRHPATGLVLFSYYNPVFSKGVEAFADAAAAVGIDAVLVVDLPLEERDELVIPLHRRGVSFIPLIAPNTPLERVKASEQGLENAFLYIITVKGTTGARDTLPDDLAERLDKIRSIARLPVAAGFGISSPEQAAEVSRHADGYIIGTALMKELRVDS